MAGAFAREHRINLIKKGMQMTTQQCWCPPLTGCLSFLLVSCSKFDLWVVPQGQLMEVLEPYDGKLSSTVLRGEEGRKPIDLPGVQQINKN